MVGVLGDVLDSWVDTEGRIGLGNMMHEKKRLLLQQSSVGRKIIAEL